MFSSKFPLLTSVVSLSSASLLLLTPVAKAVTISNVGVEVGTSGSGFAVQNWSNPGVAKAFDLAGSEVYGTSGFYQIRPMPWDPGSTNIGEGVGAGNNLGITAGSYPTLYAASVMLSSITGEAGTYVNYPGYPIFRGPDGSALYRQGSLSVSVGNGPFNTPSGTNNGYFGAAFSFTMGMSATFRVGITADTAGNSLYAPDYVSLFNGSTGTVYSSLLTRDGTPDMAIFEIDAAAGDSFTAAVWQLAGTQSVAPFGLITFDVSQYKLDVASGVQTNASILGGAPAALLKMGAGTTVLTGVSTYQGATTISNGAVEVGGAGQLAGGSYSGAVALASNTASLRITTSANQTLSGAISGAGALAKAGSGTLTLSGSNSYSGSTTISGGRVLATSTNALGNASAAVTVSGGAYLDVRTNITRTGTVTFDGGFLATGGTPAALINNGGSFVLTNAAEIVAELGGTAGLTSGGSGTNTLWRSNSYTGVTLVTNGTLRLDGSGGLSTSTALEVASGATFSSTGTFLTSNNLTVAGLTGAGTVTGAAGTLTINKATNTADVFSGSMTGGIGLTLAGATQLWLAGSNSYTGVTTVSGTNTVLNVAHANGLGSTASGTIVDPGAVLRIQGTNSGGSGIIVGAEALTISGDGRAGNGGALRSVSGTNTWQGKVTLAANARIGAASGSVLTIDVASGNAIESANLNLTTEGAGHIQVNDAISLGTGSLTKLGTGSLVLGAANSFTGATAVTQGVLNLNSSAGASLGSSTNVTVASGAALLISQSGQVNDSASVTLSGGTIAKGSGAVTEAFGALTLSATSFLDFGSGTGNFTFATYTPSTFKLTFQNFNLGNSLTVTTGTFAASEFDFNGFGYSWDTVPSGGFTITAIPEPSTVLAAVGLAGLMLWPVRRWRFGREVSRCH